MAQEKKPKSREHKESKGSARGARKVRLTPIQKILLVNGGIAHHTRKNGTPARATKRAVRERAERAA